MSNSLPAAAKNHRNRVLPVRHADRPFFPITKLVNERPD
jgi:hypothetical protein